MKRSSFLLALSLCVIIGGVLWLRSRLEERPSLIVKLDAMLMRQFAGVLLQPIDVDVARYRDV